MMAGDWGPKTTSASPFPPHLFCGAVILWLPAPKKRGVEGRVADPCTSPILFSFRCVSAGLPGRITAMATTNHVFGVFSAFFVLVPDPFSKPRYLGHVHGHNRD